MPFSPFPRLRPLVLLFASLLPLTGGAEEAPSATLSLQIQGLRNASGDLRIALYDQAESFRKEALARRIVSQPAQAGEQRVKIDGLAPGRYAVVAYHDENANEKLDLRFGMFPLEGYGLSNNPQVVGPPRFAESAFELIAPETQLEIRLNY